MTTDSHTIKAVLFDFDGTLSRPGAIDFAQIRQAIGCPAGIPVLEFIESLPGEAERRQAHQKLDRFELDAAAKSLPNPGAREIITQIHEMGLAAGIITRNSRQSVLCALSHFEGLKVADFDLIISRDDPVKPKPSGQGILLAAQKLQIAPGQILMVGDFVFDIQAGIDAGALTALLNNGHEATPVPPGCDFKISRLDDIKSILQLGRPLGPGKLPNAILGRLLRQYEFEDPSVLISAGIGDDTAAVNVKDTEVLVLKSDPITFATESISQYAVVINANDIATSGADPRWFLTTLLFPPGTTALAIRHVMAELYDTCRRLGITLCGGHTEITEAVARPVIIGMMAGTVRRSDLIDKRQMTAGNRILVTKGIAVEGTAIIARQFEDRLKALGIDPDEIRQCQALLSQINILPEARLAARHGRASALHDVTEGGLATALDELSVAGGHRLRINLDLIPILPSTQKICGFLGIDPLGLIGSGSLLICCAKEDCTQLIEDIQAEGIAAACIGEVGPKGQGIDAHRSGRPAAWPNFSVDEITRLFQA